MSTDKLDSRGPELPQSVSKHPCVTCQRRKVKCDRKFPCTRCVKSGDECRQPEAHRAPRRPRRTQETNVIERVRQLEDSLAQMRALVSRGKHDKNGKNDNTEEAGDPRANMGEPNIHEDSVGRLIIDDEKTRYISGSSWAHLADQVSDLRTLLEDDDCSIDETTSPKRSLTHYLSDGMFPSTGSPGQASYSQLGLGFLWQTYIRNVDPTMKAFHVPTMQPIIDDVLSGTGQTSKGTDCFLAATKFAAVTTLTDEQCWASLNASRRSLLDLFRSEVQATLNAANFLATHELITLQAFAAYQFCNRRHEHPRAMWIASGIALRLAQSIGLHRDGALMKLPVLATEIRRRLFWELRLLDLACAEDCGYLPTYLYGADTRLPLNINDTDISSETLVAPSEREGFTDMTYPLIRYEMCSRLHRLSNYEGRSSMGNMTGDYHEFPGASAALADCKSWVQSKYLQFCSPSVPFQKMTLINGHVILAKQTLISQYPLFQKQSSRSTLISQDLRDELFETSCDILEWSDEIIKDPETSPFTWTLQTYVHWHPVAFLLNELCTKPQHKQRARAWRAIDMAFAGSHGLSAEANSAIWRPLRGLLEKAKAAAGLCSHEKDLTELLHEESVMPPSFTPQSLEFSQELNKLPISTPDSSLVPSDDTLMAFDFPTLTPLVTMTDFITSNPNAGFDMNSWWINSNPDISKGTNAFRNYETVVGSDGAETILR